MASLAQLAALADGAPRVMDRPAMDYFLIELVPTLRASAAVAAARAQAQERAMVDAGLLPPAPPGKASRASEPASAVNRTSAAAAAAAGREPDDEDGLRRRLDALGQHVGAQLAERLCHERPPFGDTLDAIKFVCKDVWSACWDKQVDNLRTNHRGVYVLQDNFFRPIARLSSWEGRADAARRAKLVRRAACSSHVCCSPCSRSTWPCPPA
jgi:hypothetical protein